jgi:2-phosphosulfolactate phosphatase
VMTKSVWIEFHSGAAPDYGPGHVVVVVDVIRSCTTAITGISAGRRCFPVSTIDAALELAASQPGALLVGELGGKMPYGFDVDNSPAQLLARGDAVSRPFILLSTSGTGLMCESAHERRVYVACLRNVAAQVTHLVDGEASVALIGAATRGEFREEDQICCARIAAPLMEMGFEPVGMAEEIVARWRDVPVDAIRTGKSSRYLAEVGRLDDLEFILSHVDDVDGVFEVQGSEIIPAGPPDLRATSANQRAAG